MASPYQKKTISTTADFDTLSIKLASPDNILEWSYGEVTKPETINYRTQRPEKNGLFDEKIFGPEKDFECYCGKYRGIRFKGIICEKCGVEVTRSIVRRERMGHIELATPVSHIWFLRGIPSRIALLLGTSAADIEKVVYFAGYIITKVFTEEKARVLREVDAEYKTKVKAAKDEKSKAKLKELVTTAKQEIESINEGKVLDEMTYHRFALKYSSLFEAEIGAEAIYKVFKKLDLEKLRVRLEEEREHAGAVERAKLTKRLSLIKAMIHAGVRPEWMFMVRLPVIPPALRPMVALEGGRHATSDLNDLYRRVINRNNRLKKLKEIHAPDVILRNEKRILQEAVDALIDNSIRHGNTMFSAMSQSQRRPLKSLSDYLKGKQGYFRANLLGKRVDYSGRSVIVIGPDLKLDQCGLPKHMALELFRPFVIARLLEKELAYNIRGAGRLIEEGIPEVWAILEEVIKDKYVLLNRAPTLHRQGVQAFRPVLIEGNAIQIHPLVCPAFNADFDGDQMAVHIPLSEEAQSEAREIMSANKNILKPGSGDVVISTKMLDIVLGCYWMTKIVPGETGEDKFFSTPNAAITAYDFGAVGFRAKIKVMPTDSPKYTHLKGKVFETSVGRLLFNSILPRDYPFMNDEVKHKTMMSLMDDLVKRYGLDAIPDIIDKVKGFGFRYATHSGITWSISDVRVPEGKAAVVEKARAEEEQVIAQYKEGLLSADEKLRAVIEIWLAAKNEVEKLIPDALEKNGPVYDMWQSGARGSLSQITQMSGMKGLIQNTQGETIGFPIVASMKEGLTPIEYFITTHGARKGLSDTALNTAKAGYLTRRLFDVAQDAIISEDDCGEKEGITIQKESASGIEVSLSKAIKGRFITKEIEAGGEVLFKKGSFLTADDAKKVEEAGVSAVSVRSPMTCKTLHGICQHCYGMDLTTNELVDVGEAVGTVAAQAIGEPGTQLTMRTFHSGGIASVGGDITRGLPRVEEVFEKRTPKNPALVARVSGSISEIMDNGKEKVITILPDAGQKKTKKALEYTVHFRRMALVKVGDQVNEGDLLTDGSADIEELFEHAGREKTQEYIIAEINRIYELQGATISRKHIEVIIKQLFSRRKIKDPGSTRFAIGDIIEDFEFTEVNRETKAQGKEPATAEPLVLGISDVALTRKSFLSSASFQNTTKVLIGAAVKGAEDRLIGLKENVIIGHLIPAGTGFAGSRKAEMVKRSQLRPAVPVVEPVPQEKTA
ncbi:MAG: DNA-directed RNA polymerase subunit beta' [Candidatus Taylorbacteria bacterium RIFCSPHIGHO2_01_FULL_51_15]|uniref:DNA-directed RNA polymerase subunit beta' n=1 Tax=Candidatus Taylorbacteria bacterium RIFCSPHIGHO2_01_FULL_51_15 TaxID=1802304 RepID=A0A1G2MFF0_9BACT|nr:MAG: DNA-directed RNA polymerase subunit beta' [Candidatus Taylorbacteria bacterium RIFCSPHIGHO2_01_FULL_51_15]